jgi:hypothetical protein
MGLAISRLQTETNQGWLSVEVLAGKPDIANAVPVEGIEGFGWRKTASLVSSPVDAVGQS